MMIFIPSYVISHFSESNSSTMFNVMILQMKTAVSKEQKSDIWLNPPYSANVKIKVRKSFSKTFTKTISFTKYSIRTP